MNHNNYSINLYALLRTRPQAWAHIQGSALYPEIFGTVRFYWHPRGTLVVTEVRGLPDTQNACDSPVLGFHIHSGTSCTGNSEDVFANAGTHYNPRNCPHPYHAGDMPPLFAVKGYAFSAFLTDRFTVGEIIGKIVIIHDSPDDFSTQPSGNAGTKIACGQIVGRIRR